MAPKRKAAEEYSDNPHSSRSRMRYQNMSEERAAYTRALQALRKSQNRAITTLQKTSEWQNGDPITRARLENEARERIDHNYRIDPKKTHPDTLASAVGIQPGISSRNTREEIIEVSDDEDLHGNIKDSSGKVSVDSDWEEVLDSTIESSMALRDSKENNDIEPTHQDMTDMDEDDIMASCQRVGQNLVMESLLFTIDIYRYKSAQLLRSLSKKLLHLHLHLKDVTQCILITIIDFVIGKKFPTNHLLSRFCADLPAARDSIRRHIYFWATLAFSDQEIDLLSQLRVAREVLPSSIRAAMQCHARRVEYRLSLGRPIVRLVNRRRFSARRGNQSWPPLVTSLKRVFRAVDALATTVGGPDQLPGGEGAWEFMGGHQRDIARKRYSKRDARAIMSVRFGAISRSNMRQRATILKTFAEMFRAGV